MLWQFDDGATSTEQNPKHTYNDTGSYSVTLKVKKNTDSAQTVKNDYIFVRETLEADFSALPLLGYVPLEVQFTDNSKGNPSSWYWTFGDDSTSTEQNPIHIYQTSGTFTVELTISDGSSQITELKQDYIIAYQNTGVNEQLYQSINLEIFPNPGKAVFEIRFTISKLSHVLLKVYDIYGVQLATLVDEELNLGEHSVIFDAKDLQSGMYFIQLKMLNFLQTKKLEIIK